MSLPILWGFLVMIWRSVAWCFAKLGRSFPGHRLSESPWIRDLGVALFAIWAVGIIVVPLGAGWVAQRVDAIYDRRECRQDLIAMGGDVTDATVDACVAGRNAED